MTKGLLGKIIGVILSTAILATGIFVGVSNSKKETFNKSTASAYTLVLDSSNAPSISEGTATMVDAKNVTWEYENVQTYSSGHVSVNHQGYFGISSQTEYGFTGVESITPTFSSSEGDELWLLTSVDGITWGEVEILTSGLATIAANDWRYIRFYNYSNTQSSIDVASIIIGYSCEGTSSTEDVDSAKASNVIATSSNLTYASEYNDISPNSVGGEAISFTKVNTSSTWISMGFGKTYTIGEIKNAKIEFDMKTSNIAYGKSITMINGSASVGSTIYSDKVTSYHCTNIQDDWYHIEVPVTSLISTISGVIVDGTIKDKPHSNIEAMEVNGIKINAGTCVIDNLRISSSQCELGIFNNLTYKPVVGEFYWLKTAWVGKLYPEQVTMSFSDNSMARHISIDDECLLNGSPFYLEWLASGTCTITCTVVSGYDRQVHTTQFTVTVK